MAQTKDKEYVLNQVGEQGIGFIRLWFTDILGSLKNLAITEDELDPLHYADTPILLMLTSREGRTSNKTDSPLLFCHVIQGARLVRSLAGLDPRRYYPRIATLTYQARS